MTIKDELLRTAAQRYLSSDRELRTFAVSDTEVRADGDGHTLVGHAAVFNIETTIGGFFREVIAPGAFKKTIQEADVRHLFNHNPDIVLARTTNDTLDLSEDKTGLAFAAELNMKDPDAQRVQAKVERGDVNQSSFAFRVIEELWQDAKSDDELPLRTIIQAQLFDTSTVTFPAYSEAETGLRALGLGILSEVMGLSDEARGVILRAVEGEKDLPPELEAAIAEWRSYIANLPADHPDQPKEEDEPEEEDLPEEDQPAAVEAPEEEGDEESDDEVATSDDDDESDDESGDPAAEDAPGENEEEDAEELDEAAALLDLEARKRAARDRELEHAHATL